MMNKDSKMYITKYRCPSDIEGMMPGLIRYFFVIYLLEQIKEDTLKAYF